MAEKPLRRLVEIGVTTNLHCLPLLLLESLGYHKLLEFGLNGSERVKEYFSEQVVVSEYIDSIDRCKRI